MDLQFPHAIVLFHFRIPVFFDQSDRKITNYVVFLFFEKENRPASYSILIFQHRNFPNQSDLGPGSVNDATSHHIGLGFVHPLYAICPDRIHVVSTGIIYSFCTDFSFLENHKM